MATYTRSGCFGCIFGDLMNGKVDEVEHAEITTHVDMECHQILEK